MSHTQPAALDVAIDTPVSVVSVKPIVLAAPDRGEDLQLRVSAPRTGSGLLIVVFSQGLGFSMEGYGRWSTSWRPTFSSSSSRPILTR